MMRLREALHANPKWKPLYRQGPRIDPVQSRTNSWTLGLEWESITLRNSFPGEMTRTTSCIHATPVQAFRLSTHSIQLCRTGLEASMALSSSGVARMRGCDFWVADSSNYWWGLPVLVPTCPKKMFMQGPRLKYIDIVTDTLHASSSDLIVWNTLVMLKVRWFSEIPRQWLAITTHSLEAWKERDQLSQFHDDNRRGYARVTPVALSHIGVPGSTILHADEYPQDAKRQKLASAYQLH